MATGHHEISDVYEIAHEYITRAHFVVYIGFIDDRFVIRSVMVHVLSSIGGIVVENVLFVARMFDDLWRIVYRPNRFMLAHFITVYQAILTTGWPRPTDIATRVNSALWTLELVPYM